MAHYAFLDDANTVIEVIVGKDEGEGGIDWEQHYGDFRGQVCKRTSYNTQGGVHSTGGTPFRKNYAGVGFTYDPVRDAFIPPKPYGSWILDEETCRWIPPAPEPVYDSENPKHYWWNEESVSWEEVFLPQD
jgi:hypothetical protein